MEISLVLRTMNLGIKKEWSDDMKSCYQNIRVLGYGGMACVYLVKEVQTGQLYAYKTIRKGESSQKEYVCRLALQREQAILAQLFHPSIPICVDQDTDGFYMTYIKGASLADVVKSKRQVPVTLLIQWMITICDVVSYLHKEGFVYLDMKPQNLMLDELGNLYLIDYGACQRREEPSCFTAFTPRLSPSERT